MSPRVRYAIAAGVLLLLLAVAFHGFFFYRDNFSGAYPQKFLTAQALRSGELPYWNYHDFGGQPLAGNPGALTFYPTTLLLLLLPVHVAFNLHFLLHLTGGWLAMRALCRARALPESAAVFGATVFVLSGTVISATAFYNLVVMVALIPFALLAVERRSARLLGVACGLMGLAAEPMVLFGTALLLAIVAAGRMRWRDVAVATAIAVAMCAPQLVATFEIAGELERSAATPGSGALNTSLEPLRIAEVFVWPFTGFLNDAGGGLLRRRFFSTLFIGLIALPALFRRSRYTGAAIALLLLAAGRYNPLLYAFTAQLDQLRVARFPEKLMIPCTVALAVLIATFFARTRFRAVWAVVTLVPLVWTTARALPLDLYASYRVTPHAPERLQIAQNMTAGIVPARQEYHERVERLEPLFGAVAGLRFSIGRSPDGMHSLLSRIVAERFEVVPEELQARYLRIRATDRVPNALPYVFAVPRTVAAPSVIDAVKTVEHPRFDEHLVAVAPMATQPSPARVIAWRRDGQTLTIDVETRGVTLLQVNESYFGAWVAELGGEELETVPLNVDRLGVVVPHSGRIMLRFGRHRTAIATAWLASLLLLIVLPLRERVERGDGRAGQVERPADEH